MEKNKTNVKFVIEIARLREIIARIIRHNRRIRDDVLMVAPYYRGEADATPPTEDQLIENLLNAQCNGAAEMLRELGNACKAFPQGMCPRHELTLLYKSTLALIRLLKSIKPTRELNVAKTVVAGIHKYLTIPTGQPVSPEENARLIDEHIARLIKRFCQNSDAFCEFSGQVEEKRRQTTKRTKSHSRSYPTRSRITQKRAAELTGLSQSYIRRLVKDPKNTGFPGLNVEEFVLIGWAAKYDGDKLRAHWANMANHPISLEQLPDSLRAKLGM